MSCNCQKILINPKIQVHLMPRPFWEKAIQNFRDNFNGIMEYAVFEIAQILLHTRISRLNITIFQAEASLPSLLI